MSKVEFTYVKGGRKVMMTRRFADTLSNLGYGTFSPEEGYQTRMLTAGPPIKTGVVDGVESKSSEEIEPKASEAIAKFAEEHGVDLDKVVGTGKDGRIKKSDVEAVIAAQDLA